MKTTLRFRILTGLACSCLVGAALAQTPPSLENDVRNVFSQQPKSAWPPPPPSLTSDERTVTPNQFKGGTVLGGWQTTRITSKGVMIANAGFEVPAQSAGGYSGSPAGSSWAYTGSAGLARNGGPWFSPIALGGEQGAFLQQGGSSLSQTVDVEAGTYVITFKAVGRKETGVNPLQVWFNGVMVQSWTDTQFSQDVWQTYTTPAVTVAAKSSAVLKFAGVGGVGDRATVIDDIAMLRTGGVPFYVAGSASTTAGATSLILPKGIPSSNGQPIAGQGVQVEYVTMSTPLAARRVSYGLGAVILPPVFAVNGRALSPVELGTFYLPAPKDTASERYYYSPHAQQVFATQPGVVDITWVERLSKAEITKQYVISASPVKPVKKIYWTENGFKGPVIQIPSSRVATVNVVYNTLFPSTVATAFVRPGEVANPVENTALPPEKRTCWFSSLDNGLHAYNLEGRVFVEFLGALKADGVAREQLGTEIVEVTKEPRTVLERVSLGDELVPPNNESALMHRVVAGLADAGVPQSFVYQHFPAGSAKSRLFAVTKTTPLYSAGTEIPSNEVLIYWMEPGELSLLWPKYYVGYILDWPVSMERYSVYSRSLDPALATAVQLNSADGPALVYQDDPTRQHAQLSNTYQFVSTVSTGTPVGRSLIRYINGDGIWFERVYSQLDTTFAEYSGTPIAVEVGARILPPDVAGSQVGYIRQASGTAFNPKAYLDPFVVGFEEAQRGAIIGVNALAGNDGLEIWWYKASVPAAANIKPTYWPSYVRRYKLGWPAAAPEIILASNAGSNDLPSLQAKGSIYYQNNAVLPGYNPNEEHALMLNGRAWALRDDLNLPASSEKFVLIDYVEADERPAMAVFKVLRDKPLAGIQFLYTAEAGKVLQAPMPLPILPLPMRPAGVANTWTWSVYFNGSPSWFPDSKKGQTVANHEIPLATSANPPTKAALTDSQLNDEAPRYGQFTFIDRKGTTWVYRGMHDGTSQTATFGMRYYYQTQTGFWFPSLGSAQPAVGTIVPYLRKDNSHSPVIGEALEIKFKPVWPSSAPELRVSETLTRSKYGLPAVRGQTSAEIIYQQSIALDTAGALTSVTLFDPTRAKSYALRAGGLAKIPGSAATDVYLGKTYFTRLPPHLSQRFYLDPNTGALGALILKGEFKQAALGEDYLLLNRLSADDLTALHDLVDANDTEKAKWTTAINGLTTLMQTFKEDETKRGTYIVDTTKNTVIAPNALAAVTNDDTAVDSYAISAVGGGMGYVVMAVGNGRAFTPVDEPVSVYVFRVVPPLYRGELKIIQSSNPLDEKLALRHSADFAGQPEGYDFEWMYAPPVNGAPPELFTYTRAMLLGNIAGWQRYDQPPTGYEGLRVPETAPTVSPKPAPYTSAVEATTPIAIAVRDSKDLAAHGTTLPQAVLRKEFDIATIPLRAYLSLELGSRDSADVYINQAKVAVIDRPGGANTATISSPGSAYSPLRLIYEIPATILRATKNVITVELYTDADRDSASTINVRLEGQMETENRTGWVAMAAGPGETNGQLAGSIRGKPQHVIQGNSLLTLTDNYFTMRMRARETSNAAYVANGGWSKWVEPQLAEGWIKRALAGINPFQQRVTNLFSNAINTDVSLVQQAGRRWEGDIALNLSNINRVGLIEIYETILRRGKMLSIEGTPAINYGAANDALLLAAGYLSDLYMIVGNEAYADAANPTIAFAKDGGGAYGGAYGDVSTSLFSFKGQLASSLDEELTLLRGRDNSLQPGTKVNPVYNRLVWNYTRGIDSGEAVYALNYNIKDMDGDGVVGAADAALLYPQGHGDAYGHYLTSLSGYYTLLANANFSWQPRMEAVTVLGQPVAVDYFDERKFAAGAVALARTASQIIDLTYRQAYTSAATGTWSNLKDGKITSGITRRWGVDDWAVRGWQGAYFNWMTGNSMLPAVDPDPSHEGIQKIDRTTVAELTQLIAQAGAMQQSLSNAEGRLNPLGLASGALAFDISPGKVDAGVTHFEQIYGRATTALQNTITAFANAKSSTQFLRQQEDSLESARTAIQQQEQAYTNQLIELYGTPYTDDIGPGKTYVQEYSGPDLLHYIYVDVPEGLITHDTKTYSLLLDPKFNEANPGAIDYNRSQTVSYSIASNGTYVKPETWAGRRASPGQIQTAVSDLMLARLSLYSALEDYSRLESSMEESLVVFKATVAQNKETMDSLKHYQAAFTTIETIQQALATAQLLSEAVKDTLDAIADGTAEALPTVVGLAVDGTSFARGAVKIANAALGGSLSSAIIGLEIGQKITEQTKSSLERVKEMEEADIAWKAEYQGLIYDLRSQLRDLVGLQASVDATLRQYDQAQRNLRSLVASGDRLQAERETFRRRGSALIQGYRTKDVAFRAFRDEALEKYKQLYELSARYAFLAATAYDYETGLLNPAGNSASATFLDKIVKARSPGVMTDGVPQFGGAAAGDPGLAGALAQLNGDWSVVKSRLGFNNPDRYRTTFSLRAEKFRIVTGEAGDPAWREVLLAARRDNLMDDPDAARYCLNLGLNTGVAVPGFILEFGTTITPGFNFFGQPLAGGDATFSATSFATKIRVSGVAFAGYVGLVEPNGTTTTTAAIGASSPSDPYTAFTDGTALSGTPYVYLVPAGVDSLRSPMEKGSVVRTWTIADQAVPLPFNISQRNYAAAKTWSSGDSLTENFVLRQHQAFRAVGDGTVFSDDAGFTNGRLIGRSVWNSRWKLIIPAETLLSDPKKGMQVFIDSVKNIKIHFETYSTAGN